MNQIITDITRILKDSNTLIDIELELESYFSTVMGEMVASALERVDLEVVQDYKENGWEIAGTEPRTISFSFGPVTYKRRRMRKKGEKSVLALDRTLGLKKHKRYTPLVGMKAAHLASDSVYRKAADAINLLTPISISHSKVHTLTQKVGETLQKWTDEAPATEQKPLKDKKRVPVLFIEGDGVLLKGPEEKRPELHRVQFHEGVLREGKRPKLKQSKMFESTHSSQEAFDRAGRWLEAEYDLRHTIVVTNSDGGSGYGKQAFEHIIGRCARHEHVRDPYHVHRKIKKRMRFDKKMESLMIRAVRTYDWDSVEIVWDTALSRASLEENGKEIREELVLLKNYLARNWESIRPLKMRNVPVDNGIGICESNHRPFSYRMKHQGRGFKAEGAGNLASVISARKNRTLLKALTTELPVFKEEVTPKFKGAVRAALKRQRTQPSRGAVRGRIANYSPSSSPIGKLAKMFN